jgi:hypothetical protein
MIGKGPGWSHSLRLIELFPDLPNLLSFIHRELRSINIKVIPFFVTSVVYEKGLVPTITIYMYQEKLDAYDCCKQKLN